MEAQVSEILENVLGLLALEGSFEVVEGPEEIVVSIETTDPGRLIGFKGETLDALQLLVNQIVSRQNPDKYKRVVIDVAGWRKSKEGDLERRARQWAEEIKENGKSIELDPMPSWQRRIVHMVISEIPEVESESVGEGKDRHLVIKPVEKTTGKAKKTAKKEEDPAPTEEAVEDEKTEE